MNRSFLASAALYSSIVLCHSATYTWDPIATPGLQDGGGIWDDNTASAWRGLFPFPSNWPNSTSLPNSAFLGVGTGSAGVVTVLCEVYLDDLSFAPPGSGNYIIEGGILNFLGTPLVTTNVDATITSVIKGTNSLSKTGAGALFLQASKAQQTNSYFGTVTVDGGTLFVGGGVNQFAADSAINGSAIVASGAVLRLGQSEVLANDRRVTVNAGGTFDLNGFNETVGVVSGSGTIVVSSGHALGIDFSSSIPAPGTFAGILTGNGGLHVRGGNIPPSAIFGGSAARTFTVTGANTYTGPTIIGGGKPTLPGLLFANALPYPVLSIEMIPNGGIASPIGMSAANSENLQFNAGTLRYTGSSATTDRGATMLGVGIIEVTSSTTDLAFTGAIKGEETSATATRMLFKTGLGTLTLSGVDDNQNLWVASDRGKLVLAKASSDSAHAIYGFGDDFFSLGAGATIQLAGTGNDQIATTARVKWAATLDMNGCDEGFDILNGSGVIHNNASGTLSRLTLGEQNGSSSYSGRIEDGAGQVALAKVGTGTLTLSGTNTFTGGTNVRNGALVITSDNSPGTFTVNDGATIAGTGKAGFIGVSSGGSVNPGRLEAGSSLGVLTAIDLRFDEGKTVVELELPNAPSENGDLIDVSDNLTFLGSTDIFIRGASASIAPGLYTLFTYGGVLQGDETRLAIKDPGSYRHSFAFIPTANTPGSVQLNVSGASGTLVWQGDLQNGKWDIANVANWENAGIRDTFRHLDHVVFDAASVANNIVTLTGNLDPGSITVAGTLDHSFTFTGSGSIVGGGTVKKQGDGLLTIATANSYTGGTFVDGGILRLGDASALGVGSVTINQGTLDLNGFRTTKGLNVVLSGAGFSGGGAVVNNEPAVAAELPRITGLTLSGDGTIGGAHPWEVFGVVNGGNFALTKVGLSEVVWRAQGLVSTVGSIFVNSGTLTVKDFINSLGNSSSPLTVRAGAELATTTSQTKPLVLNGAVFASNASAVITWSGDVFLAGNGAANTLDVRGLRGRMTLTGEILGSGGFDKIGPGTLELRNVNNSYAGETRVMEGTLVTAAGGKLSPLTKLFVDGTVNLTNVDQSVRSLSGSGLIRDEIEGAARLTLTDDTDASVAVYLPVTLVKEGSGTLTLVSDDKPPPNSFFGSSSAIVNRGTLILARDEFDTPIFGSGERLTIGLAGVVRLAGTSGDQISEEVDVKVEGTLDLNGRNEGFAALFGAGLVTNTAPNGSSTLTLNRTFSAGSPAVYNGKIENGSGLVSLLKTGSNTQYLNGDGTYTGGTVLRGGALVVNGDISTSPMSAKEGILSGSGKLGDLVVGGGTFAQATLAPGSNPEPDNTGTLTVASLTVVPDANSIEKKFRFDLRADSTPGVGDQIRVGADIRFDSRVIASIHLVDGFLVAGTYPLLTYGGFLTGAQNLSYEGVGSSRRQTIAFEPLSTPGVILLRVTGNPASLTWIGDGNGATTPDPWDNFSHNWADDEVFSIYDAVTFNDAGAIASPGVLINGGVNAGAGLRINNGLDHPYLFTGSGSLIGSGKLFKSGPGALRINLRGNSNYSGGTVITEGTIISGVSGIGTGPVTLGTTETLNGNVAFLQTNSPWYSEIPPIVVASSGSGQVTIGAAETVSGESIRFRNTITLGRPTTLTHRGVALDVTYLGGIGGNVGLLTVNGGAKTIISGTNTFVGDIAVRENGTVLQVDGKIPPGTDIDVEAGATFSSSSSTAIGALTGGGRVEGFGLTLGFGDRDSVFGGMVGPDVSLIKIGLGGLTLTGTNAISRTIQIVNGTLVVLGSMSAQSETSLADGTLLTGTGSLGRINLANGAHIAPGFGIGALSATRLSCGPGAVLDFELGDSESSDFLDLSTGAFEGSNGFLFDFHNTGADHSVYRLIAFGSTAFTSGAFNYANLADGLTGTFKITPNELLFVTVPEPSVELLIASSLTMLLGLQRSRHRD